MSGGLTHQHTMEGIRLGTSWFIEKPFSRAQLETAIAQGGAPVPAHARVDLPLEAASQQYVERVLAAHRGNKSAAARVLGIARVSLQRRLKRRRQE